MLIVDGCYPQMPVVFAFLQLAAILHGRHTIRVPLVMGVGRLVLAAHLIGLLLADLLGVVRLRKFGDGHRSLLIAAIELLESLVLTLRMPFGVVVCLCHGRVP